MLTIHFTQCALFANAAPEKTSRTERQEELKRQLESRKASRGERKLDSTYDWYARVSLFAWSHLPKNSFDTLGIGNRFRLFSPLIATRPETLAHAPWAKCNTQCRVWGAFTSIIMISRKGLTPRTPTVWQHDLHAYARQRTLQAR